MVRIHGCRLTSREAMLFMKYEHYGKCKGSFKDSQRKCKYWEINFVEIPLVIDFGSGELKSLAPVVSSSQMS